MSQHTSLTGALAHAIDTRLVVDTVPYALRTHTGPDIGHRGTDYSRYADPRTTHGDVVSYGGLHMVTEITPNLPASKGVRVADAGTTDFLQAAELYRMRTKAHLYEDSTVEMALDCARITATRMGRLVADCHGCHTTNFVQPTRERCPRCGREME